MVSDPQLERRMSRLENDRDSLYELVAEISSTQQEHSRRFDAVDRRLDGMDVRFNAMDERFDAMDERFDTMTTRFDSVEATLAEVVRRLPEPS